MKLRPILNNAVIRILKPDEIIRGIHIPEDAQEKPQQAIVVAVGPGYSLKDGTVIAPQVKIGDKVVFSRYSASTYTLEQEDFVLLDIDGIMVVIEETA